MSLLQSRYDLLRTRVDRLSKTLPGVEVRDPHAVHRARVASRRLRELLPVLEMEADARHKLARRLRKATRRLGRVREHDALLLLLEELKRTRRYPDRVLGRVLEALKAEQDARYRRRVSKTVIGELRRLERKLDDVADASRTPASGQIQGRGWRWALDARVARRAEILQSKVEAAGGVYLPDRLHAVRIALKRLRYGLELSVDAGARGLAPDLRILRREQELLGRLHDQQVLIDRVRVMQASLTPPDLLAWRELDSLVRSLENSCRLLHARYVRDRQGLLALCDRLIARSASAERPPAARAARRAG
jgi:CHAD domain-containing protein